MRGGANVRMRSVGGNEWVDHYVSASAWRLSAWNAGAISAARRISSLETSKPRLWAPASPLSFPARTRKSQRWSGSPNGADPGRTSRKSSSRLPARSTPWFDNPVTLPPGRDRLATRPPPTGSFASAKTMGMTDVACLSAGTALATVTMTSTLSRTNSAAISAKRSGRPSAQRYSIVTVRPSIQPRSPSRCTKTAVHGRQAEAVAAPRKPITGTFAGCCARATSGHGSPHRRERDELAPPDAEHGAPSHGCRRRPYQLGTARAQAVCRIPACRRKVSRSLGQT